MEIVEKTGVTVEEAIASGLAELGVEPSQVMVEVVQEPDPGIRGEGAKEARVRLILLGGRPTPPKPEPSKASDRDTQRDKSGRRRKHGRDDRGRGPSRARSQPPQEDLFTEPADDEIPDEEADAVAREGKAVLAEMLKQMGLTEAHVGIRRAEAQRADEQMHWVLNISGNKMNLLISRRGETLSALQYLTRLIVSRKMQTRANLIVDAAGYKYKRSSNLQDLAVRMADRAVKEGRTITLEPMPPNERRIVHMALRERDDVETHSVGEGKSRKVTITPVRPD